MECQYALYKMNHYLTHPLVPQNIHYLHNQRKVCHYQGGEIRQSVLIKILSILNIFYITGKSLFLITIVKIIEPIIFFVNYEGSFVETERHIYYRSNILFLWCLVVSMPLRRRLIFKWILLISFTSISFFLCRL